VNSTQITDILLVIQATITLFISLRAFSLSARIRDDTLFSLGLSMGVIALGGMIGLLSGQMGPGLRQRQRDEAALATIASLVGAVVLARPVNDPKLSDLKQLLATSGFHAEFSAGVLYVNNIACIRRNEAGRFHVEGCACDDYYRIREIVYAQFAIV